MVAVLLLVVSALAGKAHLSEINTGQVHWKKACVVCHPL